MPGPLSNPRHERFAQALAKGHPATKAYVLAGFEANDGNAGRLNRNEQVRDRVMELLEVGARRAEVTVERVVREFAKIGFADIRSVVRWTGNQPILDEAEAEDSGEVEITAANFVRLVDSAELDDDTAAAISEVSQTKDGMVKVKMLDKQAALVSLARYLGMFVDKVEHSGAVAVEAMDEDSARAIIRQAISRQREGGTPKRAEGETIQ